MRFTTGTSITSVALALLPYFGAIADAQTIDQERLEAVHALLSQVQTTLEKLPDAHKRILREAPCNRASSRTASDNDVVSNFAHVDLLSFRSREALTQIAVLIGSQ